MTKPTAKTKCNFCANFRRDTRTILTIWVSARMHVHGLDDLYVYFLMQACMHTYTNMRNFITTLVSVCTCICLEPIHLSTYLSRPICVFTPTESPQISGFQGSLPPALPSAWCTSRCTQGTLKEVPRRDSGMGDAGDTGDAASDAAGGADAAGGGRAADTAGC